MYAIAQKNIADVLEQVVCHTSQYQAVVVYDTKCELARVLTDAYKHCLPEALFIDFETHTAEAVLGLFAAL
ncbi:MAG: hypothetical protein RL535_403 [Pseudomonadota bacterium]